MEVIAFFGPPGTGKSDRALVVAYENKASCIIDDGILIYHSRIVAGKSAKREESRLKAVRRAIFWDAEQREEVRQALEKINPKRVLILGTSDRMVETICKALGLPKPSKYIRIQDVARPDEMLKAKEARNKEGKHVIPVPTMELKPYFKGYLIDPLRFFRNRKKEMPKRFSENEERSVVRPVFSYYGKLSFSDRVIESLVYYAVRDMKKIRITYVRSEKSTGQMNGLILFIDVSVKPGTPQEIKKIIHTMRDRIQREIEHTTGMSLDTIKVNVTTGVTR
ncbi:hypothetical protein [Dialister hominis]|jgi:uncharacterized alkaline shock family protein YloU|uniref:hypothetical protein n=1 Tax=Dialister TaxID=39948 RepID=UPI00033791BE|nr:MULTISPECIES: hypothetical protein [environmental samples]MCH3912594.1 hypothetical protein [Dialister sp.]MEE1349392.1 hypothetical protein [Dialister hominis]HJI43040.1 hypothetical protein [Veillonellaceae bacterium]MCH3929645.1 hypothetical protein [Dialister sp.]CDD78459.1 putative uncharacterized protein [Dialister sp. CAG:357]